MRVRTGDATSRGLDEDRAIVRHLGVPGHPDHADSTAVRLRRAAVRVHEATDDVNQLLRELAEKERPAEAVR
jgi:hypothetical protein